MLAMVVLGIGCGPVTRPEAVMPREVRNGDFHLLLPEAPKALLILFPCYGCDAADTRTESRIVEEAMAQGVAVLLMEFNRHLFLSDAEIVALTDTIANAITRHDLQVDKVVLGGFSSGGNVSVLLAKHWMRAPDERIPLKGLFVVDSPLDLAQLYPIWQRHAEHSPVPGSREEGAMVIALLDSTLGNPTDSASKYEAFSPVTTSMSSVEPLMDLAFRMYSEPDTAWWRINRGDRYVDMNAYHLEKLHGQLREAGSTKAELIFTTDRGIQHGRRHPHAWSIVEEKDLLRWVLDLR